jgi:hypothetical protein
MYLAEADLDIDYTGDGSSGVYLWGAKIEQASAASRYVPISELQGAGDALGRNDYSASKNGLAYEVISNPELITNGSFDADTDWTKNPGWTISGGAAHAATTSNTEIRQEGFSFVAGQSYAVTFTLSNYESGSFTVQMSGGGSTLGSARSANGTYTEVLTPAGSRTQIGILTTGGSGATGTIDNVSITLATGTLEPVWGTNVSAGELLTNGDFSDGDTGWTVPSGWTISGGVASCDGTNTVQLTQAYTPTVGQLYLVTFDVTAWTSGNIRPIVGAYGDTIVISDVGSYSVLMAALSGSFIGLRSSAFNGSVDNVSIKEVAAVDNNGIVYEAVSRYTVSGALIHEARTNSLLQSRDFTTSPWTTSGSPTSAQDQVGVDGVANTAWTLGDDNGADDEFFTQTVTIPDDSNTHVASIFIKKDSDESRFPEFVLFLGGGSFPSIGVQLNTKTGATTTRSVVGTTEHGVIDCGDWWRLWGSVTNDGTGNTTATFRVAPAISTTFGTKEDAATGTIVADSAQLELIDTFPGPVVHTTTTAQTTNSDDLSYPEPGWVDSAATVAASWKQLAANGATNQSLVGNTGRFYMGVSAADVLKTNFNGGIGSLTGPGFNTEHHAAISWSGTSLDLALLGDLDTNRVYDGDFNFTTIWIGTNAASGGINGTISDVMLYTNDVGRTTLAALTDYD